MRQLLLFLLTLSISQGLFAQEPTKAVSQIDQVTVYLQGAQITRSAEVNLKQGDNVVLFSGLADGIWKNSIQATAPASVLINSVSHEVNYLEPLNYTPRVKEIKDSLKLTIQKIRVIDDEIGAIGAEKAMILKNQQLAGEAKGVATADLMQLADFYRSRLTTLASEDRKQQRIKKVQNETKNRLNKQLRELNANKTKASNDIVVKVRADRPTKATIALRFIVQNAGWVPAYDLRVQDALGPIDLTYRADVYQSTGIDWEDVKLSLSSADPSQSGVKPELVQWNLRLANPMVYDRKGKVQDYYKQPGYNESDKSIAGGAYGNTGEREGLGGLTLADYTNVVQGVTSAEFQIDIRQRIPSDGKAHQVSVQDAQLPATYLHSAVPKLDATAYLLARIIDWEKLNLLPGAVNIFFEGTYIAESFIDPNYTQDTLAFSLGRDPKVIVERKQLKDHNKVRSLGANRARTFGYEITVRNTKSIPIEIELADQVPVSQDEDISVKVEELSGGDHNLETGKVTWKLALAPAESKTLKFIFSVKHPKKKTVPGI